MSKTAARPPAARSPATHKAKAAPGAAPDVEIPVAKVRLKLVRDSFTMPRSEFDLIDVLKARALGFERPTKKSELLRAGLQVLASLNEADLKKRLDALALLKTGRPKKYA